MGWLIAFLLGLLLGRLWGRDDEKLEQFQRESIERHKRLMARLAEVLGNR
jgi:hypothetical protein